MAKRYVRKKKGKGVRLGLWAVLTAAAILAVVLLIVLLPGDREKAPAAQGDGLWDGSWYDDGLGRIERDRPLVKGMKAFEKQTGVKPYLTLLEGVDPEELDLFAQDQYEALFSGGDHLLVVYDEWEENIYYLSARTGEGSALTAADAARLLVCIETAYADPANGTYAEAFGAGFVQGARELADGTGSGGVGLLLALSFLLVALSVTLILFLRKKARVSDDWEGEDG